MSTFLPADILLPKTEDMMRWSVVACDQFTSEPDYWKRVEETVASTGAISTLSLILPEAYLGTEKEASKVESIHRTMQKYLEEERFTIRPSSYIYIERTMANGKIRQGIIGMVDLEDYDYAKGATSPIRATEATVVERIPPRMRVRKGAPLELPHILLLMDDEPGQVIEPLAELTDTFEKVYDFDLMEEGGHITGWVLSEEAKAAFGERIAAYEKTAALPYAMGDGNHSLATAKACYEALKEAHPDEDLSGHPARYALVELENIHCQALEFEPIHRILTGVNPYELLTELKQNAGKPITIGENEEGSRGYELTWITKESRGYIYLNDAVSPVEVGVLQPFLDDYLKDHEGEIDYIHGADVVERLAKEENAIGFLLPPMAKSKLFEGVISDGALPRKTFSMGHAKEKRYYLEARKIL